MATRKTATKRVVKQRYVRTRVPRRGDLVRFNEDAQMLEKSGVYRGGYRWAGTVAVVSSHAIEKNIPPTHAYPTHNPPERCPTITVANWMGPEYRVPLSHVQPIDTPRPRRSMGCLDKKRHAPYEGFSRIIDGVRYTSCSRCGGIAMQYRDSWGTFTPRKWVR
jgi:hypothetical protein